MPRIAALVVFGGLFAQSALAGSSLLIKALDKERHRALRLRRAYGTEYYPTAQDTTPSCDANYDTVVGDQCVCGTGRQQASNGQCYTPATEQDYTIYALSAGVPLSIAITTSEPTTGPSDSVDTQLCAALSSETTGSTGWYLQDNGDGNDSCWLISTTGAFLDPTLTGIPFTPSTSSRKRDVGVTGTIGGPGGILAFSATTVSAASPSSCDPDYDTQNIDGSCTCGAGRVHPADTTSRCVFAASQAARVRRSIRRAGETVQW